MLCALILNQLPLYAQDPLTEGQANTQTVDSEEAEETIVEESDVEEINDNDIEEEVDEQDFDEDTSEEEYVDEEESSEELEEDSDEGFDEEDAYEESQLDYEEEEPEFFYEDPRGIEIEDEEDAPPVLMGHISAVPGGTKLKVILETPVDEITSMVGDEITARISENVIVDGEIIIPAGSSVIGEISEINLARRLHRAGSLRIEFKNLTLPDDREIPIVASLLTHSGLIKGKYTKKRALISGATILGPAAAGLSAGLVAEGSAVGAGVGAGLGLLAGLGLFAFQRGNMVDLRSGDELDIELVEEALVPVQGEGKEKKYCDLE